MNFRPALIPAVLWLIIATILFCLPGAVLPEADWLSRIYFDKWAHVGIFSLLCFFWGNTLAISTRRQRGWLWAVAVIYGIGIEWVQHSLIPNRSFSIMDIVADSAGALLGVWAVRFVKK